MKKLGLFVLVAFGLANVCAACPSLQVVAPVQPIVASYSLPVVVQSYSAPLELNLEANHCQALQLRAGHHVQQLQLKVKKQRAQPLRNAVQNLFGDR